MIDAIKVITAAITAKIPTTSSVLIFRFHLQQHRERVFDELPEGGEELRADRAVDNAVIARQSAGHHRRDRELPVLDDRARLAGADREDAALRRVDDRFELEDAIHAEIGDRESAALELLELQFAGSGALGEILAFLRDLGEAL